MKTRLFLTASLAAILAAGCSADGWKEETVRHADDFLDAVPVTVTSSSCPRSAGGIHDFYSEGDYWWPDPENPDGPYIRRDGESNPDNFSDHRHAMVAMSVLVGNLTSAWIITGEEKYAEAAQRHLRAWFVDEPTRMNPSLLYAQAIKGRVTGRGIGIIDTIHLVEVAQCVIRLSGRGAISGECAEGCREWFREYLAWMDSHEYGLAEKAAKNNHGTWWFVQAAEFARLTGNEAMLDECRQAYRTRFLEDTMASDGSFPQETARTKPYNYSIFQLEAMVMLCQILSTPEDDLWSYTTADGRNIRLALDFMRPYIVEKESWPFPRDVSHWDEWPVAVSSYALAWKHFGDRSYLKAWEPYDHFPTDDEIRRNIAIRNPLVWF